MPEKPAARRYLGVDLGTTNSSVCYTRFNAGSRHFDDPIPVPYGEDNTLQSILLLDESLESVVSSGKRVLRDPNYVRAPQRVYQEFKLSLGAHPLAAKFTNLLSQELLRGVKDLFALKELSDTEFITSVGSPAEWILHEPDRVELIRQAVGNAGFPNIEVITEPVGAMYYHNFLRDIYFEERPQRWLVVDIGGGTTDIAIVKTESQAAPPVIEHTYGEEYGGKDFDRMLLEKFLLPRYWTGPEPSPKERVKLRKFIKDFKEEFSRAILQGDGRDRYAKNVDPGYLRIAGPVVLTLADFNSPELAEPLIIQFKSLLERSFREFGGGLGDIDRVILTGGSARWFFVRQFLEFFFNRDAIVISENPELTIAKGLALARTGFEVEKPAIMATAQSLPAEFVSQPVEVQPTSTTDLLGKIQLLSIGDIRLLNRETCRQKSRQRIYLYAAGGGGGAAALSFVPGLASAGLPVLEAKLVLDISKIYGYKLDEKEALGVFGGMLASGMIVKLGAVELAGMIPGIGIVIKGGAAASFIFALGEAAIKFFEYKRFGSESGANEENDDHAADVIDG